MQSGIYALISKIDSDKIYIGSAVNLLQREKRHSRELAAGNHFNYKLQNHYNKYGPGCFDFYVIQHIKPKYLIAAEQFHINAQKPFFNICTIAGSRQGCKMSAITRKKISDSWKRRPPISMFSRLFKPAVKQ